MKLAVIKTGGKQYVVAEKNKVKIEKLDIADGTAVEFDALLLADGDNVEIGAPLAGKVQGIAVRQGRTAKVIGVKYKRKTREKKKFGHRLTYTEVEITKI